LIEDKRTKLFAVPGGLASAKSSGLAVWFIDRSLLNRNSRFSWGS
jgi:hypothetical protein